MQLYDVLTDEQRKNIRLEIEPKQNEYDKLIDAYEMQFQTVPTEEEMYYNEDFDPYLDEISDLGNEIKESELILNQDDYKRNSNQYVNNYNDVLSKYFSEDSSVVSDSIGRDYTATIISNILKDESCPKSHFNIGIYGKWGSGKSTLIHLIKEQLSDEEKRIHVVDIDASEYEDVNKIWYNILKNLFISYEEKIWFANIRYYSARNKPIKKKRLSSALFLKFVILYWQA